MKKNYYVVWQGVEPGIYNSWKECRKQVEGFPDAQYKGFADESEAREAFLSLYEDYKGKTIKPRTDEKLLAEVGLPVRESIAVDAACSGNPGALEYRGVETASGKQIFYQGKFDDGTNNVGEFLAIVHALALLKQQNNVLPVYSDSIHAIAWVAAGKANTKMQHTEHNAKLFDLIARAEKWLATNKFQNQILKWHTAAWGEIPADFGRK
ncbi:MAG: ribonuclease H family protein [Paludibacter sp.]|nr:ribonuclease H family protein [Paludibacter sp.]